MGKNFNIFFSTANILFIILLYSSCQTMFDKPQPGKNTSVDKAYSYKRKTPLEEKYPSYQPFKPRRSSRKAPSTEKVPVRMTKKFVVITSFSDQTDKYYDNIDQRVAQILEEKLKTSKHIIIEDSKQLFPIIGNSTPGADKDNDIAIASLIGKNINLSSLITGKINHLDFNSKGGNIGLFRETKYICDINMDIRLIDIGQQKIIYQENISGSAEKSISHFFSVEDKKDYHISVIDQAINNAFDKISWKIVSAIEKIGWKGKIAKVDRNKIYINGGLKTGLSTGDILLVSDLGDIIYNPDTGRPIGRAPGNIKGTIRIVDFFGNDGAIAVINSGSGFKDNDFVELQ